MLFYCFDCIVTSKQRCYTVLARLTQWAKSPNNLKECVFVNWVSWLLFRRFCPLGNQIWIYRGYITRGKRSV